MLTQSTRLSVGDIMQFGAVRFFLVGMGSNTAVLCEIVGSSAPHHRADIPLSWPETLRMGVATRSHIRCAPQLFRDAGRLMKIGAADKPVLARVRAAVRVELDVQRREDDWLFARRLCG